MLPGGQHIPNTDWKDKVRGYCKCFSGKDNKLGLIKDNNICLFCNANDLKYILLRAKPPPKSSLLKILIKMNMFTRKEIANAANEIMGKKSQYALYKKVRLELQREGYIVFKDKDNTIKAYERTKV